ncbi:hypothetical protein LSTR_LSTR008223 [Laodelphax striatellus]|uniref:Secreted peptide n=1 Tax=Laodelphax striatellus TaxID=195883 RepID=A0A482WVT0_LAOST|nr:hypothetical protein LSTR_LSTR008223 [Laodelphax striatellus]
MALTPMSRIMVVIGVIMPVIFDMSMGSAAVACPTRPCAVPMGSAAAAIAVSVTCFAAPFPCSTAPVTAAVPAAAASVTAFDTCASTAAEDAV